MKVKIKIFSYMIALFMIISLYLQMLPALNLQNPLFYIFLILVIVICSMAYFMSSVTSLQNLEIKNLKPFKVITSVIALIIFGLIINSIIFSPIFQASKYSERIDVVTKDFASNIAPISTSSLPLLDKDSTQRIGDRVMGEIPELISQFIVSDEYTQVNYQNQLVRVTPLEYADTIRWFLNMDEGIPGYIIVNSTTGVADFVHVEGGINYTPSAFVFKNLSLHLRTSYPTLNLGSSRFEIDDEGIPYWITPVMSYQGIGMLADVSGVVVTNATTGENNHYDMANIPTWIDNVYPSSLVVEQIDNWGTYQDGYINSIFGQKNVRVSTDGYTYLSSDEDVSLYTGITSATKDESNIGFVLVNLRNKEATYYAAPGAEEYSAMSSAQGAVQEKNYSATFPLLTNVDGNPTYLLSLKDNAGLVKAYALVDVADYQKVRVTDSSEGIEQAILNYREMLGTEIVIEGNLENSGIISAIEAVVIDGQTYYYFTLVDDDIVYKVDIELNDLLPFTSIGSEVYFKYLDNNQLSELEIFKKVQEDVVEPAETIEE